MINILLEEKLNTLLGSHIQGDYHINDHPVFNEFVKLYVLATTRMSICYFTQNSHLLSNDLVCVCFAQVNL